MFDECTQGKKIYFSASLSNTRSLSGSQTVIFDYVNENSGKCYNPNTGKFTATKQGVYYFTCSFISSSGSKTLHLRLVKNKSTIARATGYNGSHSTGVSSAVAYLRLVTQLKFNIFLEPVHRRFMDPIGLGLLDICCNIFMPVLKYTINFDFMIVWLFFYGSFSHTS